jgi:hypothetical protein
MATCLIDFFIGRQQLDDVERKLSQLADGGS